MLKDTDTYYDRKPLQHLNGKDFVRLVDSHSLFRYSTTEDNNSCFCRLIHCSEQAMCCNDTAPVVFRLNSDEIGFFNCPVAGKYRDTVLFNKTSILVIYRLTCQCEMNRRQILFSIPLRLTLTIFRFMVRQTSS